MAGKKSKQRAIIFIDGNNFYHGMRSIGLPVYDLDFDALAVRLIGDREWVGTRYYIGKVRQEGDLMRYAHQRKFLSRMQGFNRLQCFLGRVEGRNVSGAGKNLEKWMDGVRKRKDIEVPEQMMEELRGLCERNEVKYIEKAVDVMIAADMVAMAYEEQYDTAYLISADGDFTHAVEKVRDKGKRVLAASPLSGKKISEAADGFIDMEREFFNGCWGEYKKR